MTIDDVKKELDKRGWSYADLAKKICMSEAQIKDIMRGKAVLRKTLQNHLTLLFNASESAVLVYKVNLTEKQVQDLTAGQQFPATEEGQKRRAEAVEAVIRHNMQMLEQMGRTANLGPELRYAIKVLDENLPKKEGEQ